MRWCSASQGRGLPGDERGYGHLLGRSKDLVITEGFNVDPKKVGDEIDAVPGA